MELLLLALLLLWALERIRQALDLAALKPLDIPSGQAEKILEEMKRAFDKQVLLLMHQQWREREYGKNSLARGEHHEN